jgi:nucleotide-binding universal stress UspA family protein
MDLTLGMADRAAAKVHVLSIARVWGTGFGMPHPGLMPNKRELREQHESVANAVTWLKSHNIAATGQVTGTRNAAKRILVEALRRRADAIVMTADPPRHWLLSSMIWSQEPHRVRRLSSVPVYLVIENQQRLEHKDVSFIR